MDAGFTQSDLLAAMILGSMPRRDILSETLNRSFIEQEEQAKPTSKEFISNLNKKIITKEDIDNNICCSICQDDFKEGQEVYKLPCPDNPHYFCLGDNPDECEGILPWLKNNNSCPVCRYEFPVEEVKEEENNELEDSELDDNPDTSDTPDTPDTPTNSNSITYEIEYRVPVLENELNDEEDTEEEDTENREIGYRLIRRRFRYPNYTPPTPANSTDRINNVYNYLIRNYVNAPEPEPEHSPEQLNEIVSNTLSGISTDTSLENEGRRTPEDIADLIPDVIDNIRRDRLEELRIRRINQIRETIRQRRIQLNNMYNNYYRPYQDIIPEYDDDGYNNRDLDEAIRQSLQ